MKQYYIFMSVLLFYLFIENTPSIAQTYDISFKRISIEDGLSQSSVQSIIQDDRGYLWFGTQDGLNKFDGSRFIVFRHNPEDSSSLSDDWIIETQKDIYGNLWILTNAGGLNKFDPKTERFTRYTADSHTHSLKIQTRILTIYTDINGNLWIGTAGDGLYYMNIQASEFHAVPSVEKDFKISSILRDKKGNIWAGSVEQGLLKLTQNGAEWAARHYLHSKQSNKSLSSNEILSLFEDSDKKIWIGTRNGFNLLNKNHKHFKRFENDPDNAFSLSSNEVYDIFEDKFGHLWLATDAGISILNKRTRKFRQFKNSASNPQSLSNDMIRRIYEDASGTLWIGTYGGGLNHFDWLKSQFGHYKNVIGDSQSLNDNNVWSLLIDRSGDLWIGTSKGLNRFSGRTNKLRVYRHNPQDPYSLSDDVVRVIFQDRSGNLWFGTNGSGLNLFDPENNNFIRFTHNPNDPSSIAHNTIRAIYEDQKGQLWIGTWNGLDKMDRNSGIFKHFRPIPGDSTSISDNRVRCLNQSSDGSFWVGTYGGLNKFDPATEKFQHYLYNKNNPKSLSHDRVLTIYTDDASGIWIGTYGGGLNWLNEKDSTFTHFTEDNGLANNAVYGILGDGNGNLWMSSNKGISRLNIRTGTIKNYDVNDGLQSNEFNGGACFKTSDGEMLFGGINGYNRFYPGKINENRYIPPIVLTSFKVFGDVVNLDTSISHIRNIRLSYKQNFFEISFASLDYRNPEKNQYMYQLEGVDPDWIVCGNRRQANYTNLDGGEYLFRVKGTNSDGVWNMEGAAVNIVIIPPFWQTLWFRLSTIFVLIGLAVTSFKIRVRKIEKQKQQLETQVAERTEEIKERNTELKKAKRETDAILNNVEEGILLLNTDMEIKSQHSRALNKILEHSNLGGKKLLNMLKEKVPGQLLKDVEEYLTLMFEDEVDEGTLNQLNPLSEIELDFSNGNGAIKNTKHLSFQFRRVGRSEKTTDLISTVVDITDQIRLSQQLEESQERSKKQMDWLLSILHVEPQLLKEFLQSAYLELNYIEEVLRKNKDDTDYLAILEKIYRSMHLLKGNASLLDLKFFVEKSHEFEDYISNIKEKEEISGSDFVPVVLKLNDLRNTLNELSNLINRISKIHTQFRPKRTYENKVFIQSLHNLINNLSADMGKEIAFLHEHFEVSDIPYSYRLTTREILIQMIRNSIYHGIEDTGERLALGKSAGGYIELKTVFDNDRIGFSIRDDGRGIQVDKLRKKLMDDSKNAAEIATWSDNKIIQSIYRSGISTLDTANTIAGRGVGLDIVKDRIERLNGKISVNFEENKYCEFTILFPVTQLKDVPKKKIKQAVLTS
jgi:ligand-binding sensor domain-containing protein/signal transduction histidine kinase